MTQTDMMIMVKCKYMLYVENNPASKNEEEGEEEEDREEEDEEDKGNFLWNSHLRQEFSCLAKETERKRCALPHTQYADQFVHDNGKENGEC